MTNESKRRLGVSELYALNYNPSPKSARHFYNSPNPETHNGREFKHLYSHWQHQSLVSHASWIAWSEVILVSRAPEGSPGVLLTPTCCDLMSSRLTSGCKLVYSPGTPKGTFHWTQPPLTAVVFDTLADQEFFMDEEALREACRHTERTWSLRQHWVLLL